MVGWLAFEGFADNQVVQPHKSVSSISRVSRVSRISRISRVSRVSRNSRVSTHPGKLSSRSWENTFRILGLVG